MRTPALIILLALTAGIARAHDPYEITSVVYVRSNVIELLVEMEFPTGMRLAGIEPVQDVAALPQFEKAQPQLMALAGIFFDFTAGNNPVTALTTTVSLGVEEHIEFKVEYAATARRPLQFTARGLLGATGLPYSTSLTVLDMVNQKVLGQKSLFARVPSAEFPQAESETESTAAADVNPDRAASSPPQAPVNTQSQPATAAWYRSWLATALFLGAIFSLAFGYFRSRE